VGHELTGHAVNVLSPAVEFRPAIAADWPAIWRIWHAVVAAGDSYVWSPDTSEADARALWMLPPPAEVCVIVDGDHVLGTAVLKPNAPGLGDHVANASLMVSPDTRGKGVGRALGLHVLARARDTGYTAMQFNAVVATNTAAVNLWTSLGFAIAGVIPRAFRHAHLGPVDLLIMHRDL
jgi:L-amino acid N-acyltransferase YncA